MPALDIALPIIGGNAFDLGSTLFALSKQNTYEANPFLRNADSSGMVAIKTASTATQLWALNKLRKKHPKLARGIAIGIGVALSAVAVNNLRQGTR